MASSDISRLISNLRMHLPGAVDGVIKLEIYNTMNEFFQDSNVWRESIEIPVYAGVTNYDLTSTGPSTIVRLMSVIDEHERPINAYIDLETQELVVSVAPTSPTTYTAQVSLTINEPLDKEGFPYFPAWVLNLYMNEMVSGVLSRMMSQPAKPYSNTQLAAFHGAQFRSAVAKARSEANRRYTYHMQMWRFPRGWVRRRAAR